MNLTSDNLRALTSGAPVKLGVIEPAQLQLLRYACRALAAHPRTDHGDPDDTGTLHGSMQYYGKEMHRMLDAPWMRSLGVALGARSIKLVARVRATPRGTRQQQWHVDDEGSVALASPRAYTVFIYLTDVTNENGATEWRVRAADGVGLRPRRVKDTVATFARAGSRSLRLPGPRGTVVAFPSVAVHRGRANMTGRARDVLTVVLAT